MYVIDFKVTRRQAFAHGFLKGLAAPIMLYHTEYLTKAPDVVYITAPTSPPERALAGDWARLGNDIQTVIDRHERQSARA
jgi:hypothetical protein